MKTSSATSFGYVTAGTFFTPEFQFWIINRNLFDISNRSLITDIMDNQCGPTIE